MHLTVGFELSTLNEIGIYTMINKDPGVDHILLIANWIPHFRILGWMFLTEKPRLWRDQFPPPPLTLLERYNLNDLQWLVNWNTSISYLPDAPNIINLNFERNICTRLATDSKYSWCWSKQFTFNPVNLDNINRKASTPEV